MRALAVLLVLTLSRTTAAQETGASPPAESTAHRHLGFFFRATIGVGYLTSSTGDSEGLPELNGASVPLGLAVGGAVAENWILAGEVWGGFSPTTAFGISRTVFVYGYSLAVVHYLMPANVYLSFAPGLTRVSIETGNVTVTTQYGGGGKLALGKEWWVGDHWGLGLAGEFFISLNKEPQSTMRTTLAGGLTFSATYN